MLKTTETILPFQITPKYPSSKSRPILKWAGGKTQLISELIPMIPEHYGKYIEPFFGGGAFFFYLRPICGVIADSNPELINLYKAIANDVNAVKHYLALYKNAEEVFYEVRAKDWTLLSKEEAAARTIFLNRTCFNGLYRVNQKGQFNVPFGRYKNPKILDEFQLDSASELLKRTTIVLGDYKTVLKDYAKPGDLIFLDPPYLPISEYSDFKRYTKEQFYEEDHIELAEEFKRLDDMGCTLVLTNSNHPLVHDLYKSYELEIIKTKRYISCNGKGRLGEDVIVKTTSKPMPPLREMLGSIPPQTLKYPSTRYMGSKNKLLNEIWQVASQFSSETVIDLFSGSGIVGYMFKSAGKQVISNDYMHMSSVYTKALIENNKVTLGKDEAIQLLHSSGASDRFVEATFDKLYFSTQENVLIDNIRANIKALTNPYKKAIAMMALIRSCMKKRPRGIFTYIGDRYDDGRKDLKQSFEEHFIQAVDIINAAVFNNGCINKSRCGDAMSVKAISNSLVYIDPPYYSPFSDNEYVRRYHFVEGLARSWDGVEIQQHTVTKKFKSYPTPFSSRNGASEAFDLLFKRFKNNTIIVSYSSNSLPSKDEMVAIMSKYKKYVEVVPIDYKYSAGNHNQKIGDNKNDVKEYLFVGYQ